MASMHLPDQTPNDVGFDEDGYDESQRAEILEATRGGDGSVVMNDLDPDLGEDLEADESEIELAMADEADEEDLDEDDLDEDEDDDLDDEDLDEDELQEDFDEDDLPDDEDLDDADRAALE